MRTYAVSTIFAEPRATPNILNFLETDQIQGKKIESKKSGSTRNGDGRKKKGKRRKRAQKSKRKSKSRRVLESLGSQQAYSSKGGHCKGRKVGGKMFESG